MPLFYQGRLCVMVPDGYGSYRLEVPQMEEPVMSVDRPRDPLKYEPRFEFDPGAQNYQMLGPSVETVAQDMALAFARDVDGKMRAALIGMGWTPPETTKLATEAVRDALEASVRKGVEVHWDVLERQLLAAHDALTKTL